MAASPALSGVCLCLHPGLGEPRATLITPGIFRQALAGAEVDRRLSAGTLEALTANRSSIIGFCSTSGACIDGSFRSERDDRLWLIRRPTNPINKNAQPQKSKELGSDRVVATPPSHLQY
jgi:hypothetical protein